MKITIINGSPKHGESTSALMIKYISSQIREGGNNEINIYNVNKGFLSKTQQKEISESDALVFAYPLYVDSIPAHLLNILIDIGNKKLLKKNTMIYCIVNNGFFEGQQSHIAVQQLKNWCNSCGVKWGQAIGTGAGEMFRFTSHIPLGHGPNKNFGHAINCLAENILNQKSGDDLLISPNYSRTVWKIQGTYFFWYKLAMKNGVKWKDLRKRLD